MADDGVYGMPKRPLKPGFRRAALWRLCRVNLRMASFLPIPCTAGHSQTVYTVVPYGYGLIPINTIFRGMNIHLPAILMFTRGTRFWHTAILQYLAISRIYDAEYRPLEVVDVAGARFGLDILRLGSGTWDWWLGSSQTGDLGDGWWPATEHMNTEA